MLWWLADEALGMRLKGGIENDLASGDQLRSLFSENTRSSLLSYGTWETNRTVHYAPEDPAQIAASLGRAPSSLAMRNSSPCHPFRRAVFSVEWSRDLARESGCID